MDVVLTFNGPFAWHSLPGCPSIFDVPMGAEKGVYLWVNDHPTMPKVFYVGETGKTFASRMADHLRLQLSGLYHVYEPTAFSSGEKIELWPGAFGSGGQRRFGEFVGRLKELAPDLVGFTQGMRFYLASLDADRRVRERVEAAIVTHVKEGTLSLMDGGVRYRYRRKAEVEPITVRVAPPMFGLEASFEA